MIRATAALLLLVVLACAAEEGERGRRRHDTVGGDSTTVELSGYDQVGDAAPGDDAIPGETVARPDLPAPDDALDADDPGPLADASDGSPPEAPAEVIGPEASPDTLVPEPQPEATWPEPQPEVSWPEPQPEVVDTAPDTVSPPVAAYDLQSSAASVGCSTDASVSFGSVRLDALVITTPRFVASAALDGYYAADVGAPSAGAWHGLLFVVPSALGTDFAVGAVVTVEGEHREYYCMTEVYASSAVQTGVAWEPAPVALAGWQVAATNPASEPYEGVLVRIQGGTVTLVDAFGEIVIDDTWRIANEFDLAYLQDGGGKAEGDQIVSVTGVVEFSWGKYLVNPRYDAELIVTKP